ncbi:MAG: LPS export ABC transporter periplasmic protein LptC [Dokdonella sp.]
MIERRHWPIIIALVLLAAGSQFLLWLIREPATDDFVGPPRSDYTLSNFQLTALGDDGKLTFRMSGPILTRSDKDNSIYVTTPDYVMVDGSGRPWQGNSDAAWVDKAGVIMQLRGAVVMHSEPKGKDPVTITSSDLTIWPKTSKLATDARATIEQTGSTVSGTGMRADLTTQTMELLADVHNRFQTKPRAR